MSDRSAVHALLDDDEVREVLSDTFFHTPEPTARRAPPKRRKKKAKAASDKAASDKAADYRVIAISIYEDDLAALDAKVQELKARGHRRMSRSALIRYAVEQVDVDDVPRRR
jgi:hypothetical protein